jgi:thiamine pyrophosphate-dependent enzyme
MGAAVPYAIAAKIAHPDRPVIALVGDGAMQMNNMAELITVAKYWREWSCPNWVVCVFNNGDLNQVTWEQRVMGHPAAKNNTIKVVRSDPQIALAIAMTIASCRWLLWDRHDVAPCALDVIDGRLLRAPAIVGYIVRWAGAFRSADSVNRAFDSRQKGDMVTRWVAEAQAAREYHRNRLHASDPAARHVYLQCSRHHRTAPEWLLYVFVGRYRLASRP